MLRLLWKQLTQQEALIAELDSRIEEQTRPFTDEIERMDVVPGVDRRVAETDLGPGGMGGEPHQGHVLGIAVPASGRTSEQKTGSTCGGTVDVGDPLPYAKKAHKLCRPRRQFL